MVASRVGTDRSATLRTRHGDDRSLRADRPRSDRPYGDKPGGDRPYGDRPRGDRPFGGKPGGDRPFGDRPRGPKPFGGKPGGDRPFGDRPRRAEAVRQSKPGGDRPFGDRPRMTAVWREARRGPPVWGPTARAEAVRRRSPAAIGRSGTGRVGPSRLAVSPAGAARSVVSPGDQVAHAHSAASPAGPAANPAALAVRNRVS